MRKDVQLLGIVKKLTPPACPECSSAEIAAMMIEHDTRATVKGVGAMMGGLQRKGLVRSSTLRGFHLWRLTPKGKHLLRGRKH